MQNGDHARALKQFRGAETALGPYASTRTGEINTAASGAQTGTEDNPSEQIGTNSQFEGEGNQSEAADSSNLEVTNQFEDSGNTHSEWDSAQQVRHDIDQAQAQGKD